MTEKIFNNLHVLDGAMSTELEKRGVATNNKLWTAKALRRSMKFTVPI